MDGIKKQTEFGEVEFSSTDLMQFINYLYFLQTMERDVFPFIICFAFFSMLRANFKSSIGDIF